MGQAFDRDGNVMAEAYGRDRADVLRKLEADAPLAHEMRIRSLADKGEPYPSAGSPMTTAAPFARQGLTIDNVESAFQYHPWDSFQTDAGAQVRDALVAAAKVILRVVPDGPDRSVALRKLREARMDANSAITHGGRF